MYRETPNSLVFFYSGLLINKKKVFKGFVEKWCQKVGINGQINGNIIQKNYFEF